MSHPQRIIINEKLTTKNTFYKKEFESSFNRIERRTRRDKSWYTAREGYVSEGGPQLN
jgi:hypothetical protein